MAALTPKQERFVAEYLVDLNATQAAIRAGYSPKTAQVQSSRLLSNVMVAAAVAEAKGRVIERIEENTGITLERVLQEYARIAFSDIGDVMAWGDTVMVPCAPEVAEAFLKVDGSEADFPEDEDLDEDQEPQGHGGSLKRTRRRAPSDTIAVRAHTPMALKASSDLNPDHRAAISEVKQTREGLSLKMHSKQAALDKLYAHLAPEKAAAQAGATNVNLTVNNLEMNLTQVTAEFDELLNEFGPTGHFTLDS